MPGRYSAVQNHDIFVVGASAGGVEALIGLVEGLPAHFEGSIFVVLHIAANAKSLLPEILSRNTELTVSHGQHEEFFRKGHVYVAPPNNHLLIDDGFIRIVHGPKENFHRPAIDPLFRSAARMYGPRCVGVVLTGSLDDGAAGMAAIKSRGGVTIVQDPNEALHSSMPSVVLQTVSVDYTLPVSEIGPTLGRLARSPSKDEKEYPVADELETESKITQQTLEGEEMISQIERIGKVSTLTCPECHGALWEINDPDLLRYRCHVGHAFSISSLASGQDQMLENALWSALRALEEKLLLIRRSGDRAKSRNLLKAVRVFEERAVSVEQQAEVIRQVLLSGEFGEVAEPSGVLTEG